MLSSRTLFLIPARAGSKGFPGKNLALCGGIPLVGRAVRTARRAAVRLGGPAVIICSTDDEAIARTATEWGADVPFMRPAPLATDAASSLDVARHAIASAGGAFDAVVLLQPTSPLTDVADVVGCIEMFRVTGEPVVAVCRSEHPIEWHFRRHEDGRLEAALGRLEAHQRQQAVPTVRPTGAVYVASPAHLAAGGFFAETTHGFVMPASRSVDVDSAEDLAVAEAVLAARTPDSLRVGDRRIGPGAPCFVIAEAGVNHNGVLANALALVDAAADAGADAVKFQTFRAERLASSAAPKAVYQLDPSAAGESQLDMLRRLELSHADHHAIARQCALRGIAFLSTPFEEESARFLDEMGVPAFKISSGDLTNLALLEYVAGFGKPLILSTGMADLPEIDAAVDAILSARGVTPALLQCVSEYPAAPADANLRAMATLQAAFACPAGYSDHTPGIETAIAAAALGACVVEKHLTIDRRLPGPDHKASLEPAELRAMVRGIRIAEASRGDGVKRPAAGEAAIAAVARKSLVAARDIPAGSVLHAEDIAIRRPGTGLPPRYRAQLLGRTTKVAISSGTLLTQEMLA